jgi:AraC family transcriptional regulator of adaptative response / DNA-3-methyladenine glycosylase II
MKLDTLDHAVCYRAVTSRDPRFDGRFFTAVLSTGIYCRPICPARTPRSRNCQFYSCAAAAEEEGFRPCRRCRPDTAPGSPIWRGTATTVSRALRLIQEGALDGDGVDRLADRLGVGDRHLRRLFNKHLGATPVAVAQTRRAHFARQLIDQTTLPMASIAHSAGFGSVRRFNTMIRQLFGKSPVELRRAAKQTDGEQLTLRLPYRPPYDWPTVLRYLEHRAIPGVEQVVDGVYRRTITCDGDHGVVSVRPSDSGDALQLRVPAVCACSLARLVARTRRLFDLDADPTEIGNQLSRDRRLARLVRRRPGLRVPGAWDPFELAIRAILGQQVTVRGATTLAGRLVRAFGERIWDEKSDGGADTAPNTESNGIGWRFPTPDVLATADVGSIGMPEARARAVQGLATALHGGELQLDAAADPADVVAQLESLPGIGTWTAQYIAMRALADPDAFPSTDLGLRRALGDGDSLARPREIVEQAERWRPWRAYAVLHLWHSEE